MTIKSSKTWPRRCRLRHHMPHTLVAPISSLGTLSPVRDALRQVTHSHPSHPARSHTCALPQVMLLPARLVFDLPTHHLCGELTCGLRGKRQTSQVLTTHQAKTASAFRTLCPFCHQNTHYARTRRQTWRRLRAIEPSRRSTSGAHKTTSSCTCWWRRSTRGRRQLLSQRLPSAPGHHTERPSRVSLCTPGLTRTCASSRGATRSTPSTL